MVNSRGKTPTLMQKNARKVMTMLSDEQRKSKLLYVEIIFKTVENPTEVIHKLKNLYV